MMGGLDIGAQPLAWYVAVLQAGMASLLLPPQRGRSVPLLAPQWDRHGKNLSSARHEGCGGSRALTQNWGGDCPAGLQVQ